MASWLMLLHVHVSQNRMVQVRALAGDIVLCSWEIYSHSASFHSVAFSL